MSPLILLILGLSGVYCDGHALKIFRTIVSTPESGLPAYTLLIYLDNQQIVKYNSDLQRHQATVSWIKKVDRSLLEWGKNRTIAHEAFHKTNLKKIMNQFNHTGLHIAQTMYGCKLRDNGSTAVYYNFGYDGRDFMYLDTQTAIWIPIMNEAQTITQQYNSPENRWGAVYKKELENTCVEYLKTFIKYANEDLEKKVRPEVKVWGHSSEEETKLYCLVYGFHPRTVDVKWMRNGTDYIPPVEESPILPHPDGTYQIRISLQVPAGQRDSYSCHVDHSSLEEPIIVFWEPDNGRQSNVIVIVIVIAGLAALAVIAGVAFYIRKRGKKSTDYRATSTSETDSISTNNPTV